MRGAAICLGFVAAVGACDDWSQPYTAGTGWMACSGKDTIGHECTGRDPIFGECVQWRYCCAPLDSGECKLFDLSCNWNAWTEEVVAPFTEQAKETFNMLSDELKDKVLVHFEDVDIADLQLISDEVISKIKATARIRGDQLVALSDRLNGSFSVEQLRSFVANINPEVLQEQIAQLGDQVWSKEKAATILAELKARATAFKNGTDTWTAEQIAELRHLAAGFSREDLAAIAGELPKLDLSSLRSLFHDIDAEAARAQLRALGDQLWNKEKAHAVWEAIKGRAQNFTAANLSGDELEEMRNLLVGLSPEDLTQLGQGAFEQVVDRLRVCAWETKEELQALAGQAKASFGDVAEWSQDQMDKAGKMIVGLSETDLPKVNIQLLLAMNDEVFLDIDWTINPNALRELLPKIANTTEQWHEKGRELVQQLKDSELYGQVETWTIEQVDSLGILLSDLEKVDYAAIAEEVWANTNSTARLTAEKLSELIEIASEFQDIHFQAMLGHINVTAAYIDDLVSFAGQKAPLLQAKHDELMQKVKEVHGELSTWTDEQLANLGTLLRQIDVDELKQCAADKLAQAEVISSMLGEQANELKLKLAGHLELVVANLPFSELEQAMDKLATQVAWTKEQYTALKARLVEEWGPISEWTNEELDRVSLFLGPLLEDALDQLSEAQIGAKLGAIIRSKQEWTSEQVTELKETAVAVFGRVEEWSAEVIAELGPALTAVGADLQKLNKEALAKAVKLLGAGFDWTNVQAGELSVQIRLALPPAGEWISNTIEDLGTLASSVIDEEAIAAWTAEAFEGACEQLGQVQDWSEEQLAELAAKAKKVFGEVQTWSEEQVQKLGVIVQGLSEVELPKLPTFSGSLSVTVTHGLDAEQTASLSTEQLQEAAAALFAEQLAKLDWAQQQVILCGTAGSKCNTALIDTKLKIRDTAEHFAEFTKRALETTFARLGGAEFVNCTATLASDARSAWERAEGIAGDMQVVVRVRLSVEVEAEAAVQVVVNAQEQALTSALEVGEGVVATSQSAPMWLLPSDEPSDTPGDKQVSGSPTAFASAALALALPVALAAACA